jgi:hypothetical protein
MTRVEVPCFLDIEQTPETLHAHAVPEDIEIRPGDQVQVHGAPTRIGFGEHVRQQSTATVTRASALRRIWTYLTSPLAFTELFEVGFQPKEQA